MEEGVWRRRIVNDNDLLGQAVFIKLAPVRLLVPAILGGRDASRKSRLTGRHCGRCGGRRRVLMGRRQRRQDLGRLSVRQGGRGGRRDRRRGGRGRCCCRCRRPRPRRRCRSGSGRIDGVRISRSVCGQTRGSSGRSSSSRSGRGGGRIRGRRVVGRMVGITVVLRMMRSRVCRSGRGRGRHHEAGKVKRSSRSRNSRRMLWTRARKRKKRWMGWIVAWREADEGELRECVSE